MTTIVWFRNDLRLEDNPALAQAVSTSSMIIPVYIWAPEDEGGWPLGSASRWWLHHSLESLGERLKRHKGRLIIRSGSTLKVLSELARNTGAKQIFWNRRYERFSEKIENKIKVELESQGVECRSFNANLLAEPWEIQNGSGKPYRVFTPYWRVAEKFYKHVLLPLPAPRKISFPNSWPKSLNVSELKLITRHQWESKLAANWIPGEKGASKALLGITRPFLQSYDESRNYPSQDGTSRLSPHLHFGEISPRQILEHVSLKQVAKPLIRQLAWREFAHSLLYFFPQTPKEPLSPKFSKFPWEKDDKKLMAWQRGLTGYPIVDAGMRELWETGTMHNRVRMIVGSFLVKDLLIHWSEGAKWFWETLVDADLANNTMGWQWVAGSGADAAPYFRIFNPTSQAKRFDPEGTYIKKWIPELLRVPIEQIVDHDIARKRALKAYSSLI